MPLNGEQDEFDSIFDDNQLLDAALEQSLAQVEASYTAASQAPIPAKSSAFTRRTHSSSSLAERLNTSAKRSSFVPPFKKQRIDDASRNGRFLREPEADEVIVHDLRNEDFMDQDDENWWAGNQDLDHVEQEAIRMSQQMVSSQRQASAPPAANGSSHLRRQRSPSRSTISPETSKQTNHDAELRQLKEELARLRQLERTHEQLTLKLKQEAYSKAGEVAVVRQNLNKLNLENAKLREREVAREQEHKAVLDRLQLENQKQLDRLETETTFRRVEQDTSRRIWPSSVMRVPPTGVRDSDRRHDSQVRAGLTTPTKSRRFENRTSSASSGSRQRYSVDNQRDEPGTPTKSNVKGKQLFPTSVNKSKSFKGFQNSFADVGPIQIKTRQQQVEPSKRASVLDSYANQEVDMLEFEHSPQYPIPVSPAVELDPQSSAEQQREKRYLFAISEMLRRRTTMVSHVLCHTSTRPARPTTYPVNMFNVSGSSPSTSTELYGDTTLQRLTSTPLVAGCPALVVFRYKRAVDALLDSLSRGTVLEPEYRWDASVLLRDQEGPSVDEIDMSNATFGMSARVAQSLLALAGIALRTCQTDVVVDVFRLLTSLASNVACFASALQMACNERHSQEARSDELAFLREMGLDTSTRHNLDTPVHLVEILTQSIGECQVEQAQADSETEARDELGLCDWDMGADAREDLLESVVQLLETMALLQNHPTSLPSTLHLLQRPGVLHKLLHRERLPTTIFKTVRLLAFTVSDSPFVHECLAAKPVAASVTGRNGSRRGASAIDGVRMKAKFPVLEILVKHLVDRRSDLPESEWHGLHRVILIFLTQAALRSADTMAVLADSAALLAALIRCQSLDADFIWTESRPSFMTPSRLPTYKTVPTDEPELDVTGANVLQATERLVMDIRLLNLLYNSPPPLSANEDLYSMGDEARYERTGPVSLTKKLEQPETYSMLNGIRQSFIVSLSRVAFCPEPEWMAFERDFLSSLRLSAPSNDASDADDVLHGMSAHVNGQIKDLERASLLLEAIADVAGDLIDIVLSPDESDSIYDLLVADEDGATDEEMDELEPSQHDQGLTAAVAEPLERSRQETRGDRESEPDDYVPAVPNATRDTNKPRQSARPSESPHKNNVAPSRDSRSSTLSPTKRNSPAKTSTSRAPSGRTNVKPNNHIVVIDDSD